MVGISELVEEVPGDSLYPLNCAANKIRRAYGTLGDIDPSLMVMGGFCEDFPTLQETSWSRLASIIRAFNYDYSRILGPTIELGSGVFNEGPLGADVQPRYPFHPMLIGALRREIVGENGDPGNQGVFGIDIDRSKVSRRRIMDLEQRGLSGLSPEHLYRHVSADLLPLLEGRQSAEEFSVSKLGKPLQESVSLVATDRFLIDPNKPILVDNDSSEDQRDAYVNFLQVAPGIRRLLYTRAYKTVGPLGRPAAIGFDVMQYYPEVAVQLEAMGKQLLNAADYWLMPGGVFEVNHTVYVKQLDTDGNTFWEAV